MLTVQDQGRKELEVTQDNTVGNNIIMKGVGDIIDEGAYSNMGTWLMDWWVRADRICHEGEFGTLGKPAMVEGCGGKCDNGQTDDHATKLSCKLCMSCSV